MCPFLFENGDFFSGMAYRLHASSENGVSSFPAKILSRVENQMLYSFGWMKEQVFKSDYVTVLDTS